MNLYVWIPTFTRRFKDKVRMVKVMHGGADHNMQHNRET